MQQSSSTIGCIAAALAKAQLELQNPEKSLTAEIATIRQNSRDTRTFRYAPLSTGLDIVRKCLGKHEIAAIQTTTIDKEARLVRLTTTLAHTSGEWVSSDWPVCTLADLTAPQRMGSALTYARRYALFTLVGIAGEDDLDAPDVDSADGPPPVETRVPARLTSLSRPSGDRELIKTATLSPSDSERARDQLLEELSALETIEDFTAWARGAMPSKNSLLPTDASNLEQAFERRLAETRNVEANPDSSEQSSSKRTPAEEGNAPSRASAVPDRAEGGIDKSILAIATVKRQRNKSHLQFVAKQACVVCGREPSDAHHLRFAQPRGLGQKVSDEFTVPLCRVHHRQVHQESSEQKWWSRVGIDPLQIAKELWTKRLAP